MAKRPAVRKEQEGPVRQPDGTFAKGSSGNPLGQPQWVREFREAFQAKCAPKAAEVLNRILDRAMNTDVLEAVLESDASAEAKMAAEKRISDRMGQGGAAADTVLKYIIPKPTQQHDVAVTDKRDAFAGLTAEQLVELAKQKPKDDGP